MASFTYVISPDDRKAPVQCSECMRSRMDPDTMQPKRPRWKDSIRTNFFLVIQGKHVCKQRQNAWGHRRLRTGIECLWGAAVYWRIDLQYFGPFQRNGAFVYFVPPIFPQLGVMKADPYWKLWPLVVKGENYLWALYMYARQWRVLAW